MISVVIVNWNVKALLRGALQSILAAEPAEMIEIVVVDSASSDDSVAMVRAEFPQIKLIAETENVGFARGNNIGVGAAEGDFIFLLNPDTELHPTALAQMLNYLKQNPHVGVVAPQLLWPDGSVQSSRRQFPSPGTLFWESTLLQQWFPHNKFARNYHLSTIPSDQTQRVDWAVGAALFLRREVWQAVGGLDESLFMYFEETDWCRRVADAGWEIHYLPTAQVTHHEGQSSGQVFAARTLRFQRSKLRYTQKWFGSGWALMLRLFLWLTFAFQWLQEGLKWLIGHKRNLRRRRLEAYGEVLRQL